MSVNGKRARFARDGEELVVTPSRPLHRGGEFVVRVTRFTATPTVPGDDPASTGFFVHETGSATAPQPYFAHLIYPSNDHPRDKASFTFVFAEERGQLAVDTVGWPDPQGYATVVELMRAIYAHGDEWRAEFGPVARPSSGEVDNLFSFQAYHGGALVLYALRNKIGVRDFERLQRAWVDRYEHGVAGTEDFIELAARVSGRRDVVPFLRDWVYGTKTPPMPGHPDWTVNPPSTVQAKTAPARERPRP